MENQTTTTTLPYAQLHMYRPDIPLEPLQIPEGYVLRSARLEDGPQWCHCCRGGDLGIEEETVELFQKHMLADPTVSLERIFMLENQDHQIVATAAAQNTGKPNHAHLHMVANPTEFRGMGFSKYVCWAAIDSMRKAGQMTSELSSDDFRLGALKTYLRLGYVPILCREDMEGRWLAVMEKLGYTTLPTVIEVNNVFEEGPTLNL